MKAIMFLCDNKTFFWNITTTNKICATKEDMAFIDFCAKLVNGVVL